jgi:hypothetical protein
MTSARTGIAGRRYLDGGDRLSGWIDPPQIVTVLLQWGPGGGPRNVLIQRADGSHDVIPFPRRLRRLPDQPAKPEEGPAPDDHDYGHLRDRGH